MNLSFSTCILTYNSLLAAAREGGREREGGEGEGGGRGRGRGREGEGGRERGTESARGGRKREGDERERECNEQTTTLATTGMVAIYNSLVNTESRPIQMNGPRYNTRTHKSYTHSMT